MLFCVFGSTDFSSYPIPPNPKKTPTLPRPHLFLMKENSGKKSNVFIFLFNKFGCKNMKFEMSDQLNANVTGSIHSFFALCKLAKKINSIMKLHT